LNLDIIEIRMVAPHRLVLFDIDGTLLSAGRVSREALVDALSSVCPKPIALDGYEFSGKTDPQIVRELLATRISVDALEPLVEPALESYLDNLERRMTPDAISAKPGVAELLRSLSADSRVTLALLTGNHERGARLKLDPPGFNSYFPFGAFGSDDPDRYRLPEIAVERARQATGREFRGKEIVIIGDSVHDVACGRGLGVKSVAVSTGVTPAARLLAEKPDFYFEHLAQTAELLAAIAA
jgi:phosphoglycolate phosphatase-like HAD superfamily hydrolase